MLYYHVRIMTTSSKDPYYEWDKIDLSEIKERIVIPFLKEERVCFSKQFFPASEIRSIVIVESELTVKAYRADLQKKYPNSSLLWTSPFIFNEDESSVRNISDRVFKECKSQLQEITSKSEAPTPNKPQTPMDKSKVFIVHGHDDAAKEAVARFVEKIGFEAIILHEQASSGKTIIEKIEEYTNVGFGIVLYTPCDVGALQGQEKDDLKPRARQNVVFEHGYLIGKIGRENVCALVKGNIETPNDISGVVYIKMEGEKEWKYKVADEMKESGYNVDLTKI
jgi:putative nucleotide-binding protein containing TIR-like domain